MGRFLGLAIVVAAIFSSAASALAGTDILDPDGKSRLYVQGDDIKTSPTGTRVLYVDGDKILTDPGGKLVLYINGDMIRTEPNGTLLLYIDGRHIRRKPGGEELLYVDGKDLLIPNRAGKKILRFEGDDLTSQRRMAVLYYLMPDLFKVPAAK